MVKIKRMPTGIPGFDDLIEGGLVKNSTTLLSGGAGTGKTIFGLQFLCNGAIKYDEPGVFLSFEEDPSSIYRDTDSFGWNLEKLEKEKKVSLLFEDPTDVSRLIQNLESEIVKIKAKRLVFDSTSVFGMALDGKHDVRMRLFDLIRLLKKLDVTSILTAEIPEGSGGLSRFGVEEFISDGVIMLKLIEAMDRRSLTIRKMRGTKISLKPVVYFIKNKGISLKNETTPVT